MGAAVPSARTVLLAGLLAGGISVGGIVVTLNEQFPDPEMNTVPQ